jgi:hypothetical protein
MAEPEDIVDALKRLENWLDDDGWYVKAQIAYEAYKEIERLRSLLEPEQACVFSAKCYLPYGENVAYGESRSWCLTHRCWADDHHTVVGKERGKNLMLDPNRGEIQQSNEF